MLTLFDEIVKLLQGHEAYAHWGPKKFQRLILPPLLANQYIFLNNPKSYISWAYLTKEAEEGFISGERKLQREDWTVGDRLWFIDFVMPKGGVARMVRELENRVLLNKNIETAHWVRRGAEGKIRHTGLWKRGDKVSV